MTLKKLQEELCFLWISRIIRPKAVEKPIFIFGNQKSGTSAISSLISAASGNSLTLDFRVRMYIYKEFYEVLSGNRSLENFIQKNSYLFSKPIIKEPNLTFLMRELRAIYPDSKSVFILRDPLENIRSILERLKLNNQCTPSELNNINFVWKNILLGKDLPENYQCGNDIILNLASRWKYFTSLYQNESEVYLVKYEDFSANKLSTINNTVQQLGLEVTNDVSNILDVQYQPRGNRVSVDDFFSFEQIESVRTLLAPELKLFNYEN